jgi:hypothetical protein
VQRKNIWILILILALPSILLANVYNFSPAIALAPGQSTQVWNAETPTPGNGTSAASQQVSISVVNGPSTGFNAQGYFSGAPGTFEIDVQTADTDSDTAYQTVNNGAVTTVDGVNQTWRLDCGTCNARFVRLLMRSRTNNVTISAWIAR